MPSLSFTSLERLIEPATSSPKDQAGPSNDRSTPFSFHPPLYATPSQQRPPSPTAFSPSPYVLNFKRRAPVQQQQQHHQNGEMEKILINLQLQCQRSDVAPGHDVDEVPQQHKGLTTNTDENEVPKTADEISTENEVFEMELEKRDPSGNRYSSNHDLSNIFSVSRDQEIKDAVTATFASCAPVANEEVEFFDAPDSVFSDTVSEDDFGSGSVTPDRSGEGWTGRATARLAKEVERRMKAEENIASWQRRWNEMARRCALLGVSFSLEAENISGNEGATLKESNQELLVARLVEGAIARAVMRAEKVEEIEHILGVKNREISRLWDKLQYLELVNREMSQRNQEVTELTQRRKKRRQRRRKLALSGFCAVFLLGTAGLMCYKYIPWEQAKSWGSVFHKSADAEVEST